MYYGILLWYIEVFTKYYYYEVYIQITASYTKSTNHITQI